MTKISYVNFINPLKVKYLGWKYICIILLMILIPDLGLSRDKGRSAFGITMPLYEIYGIDVSRYQEKINWKDIANVKSGKDSVKITFAFVKATEGQSLKDKYFNYNWRETKKHNIIRGAYHYYKPNVNSLLQAANFIRQVKLQSGDLPPVLDIEEVGKLGSDNMKKGVKKWLKKIESHYGVKPIIYTNVSFYKKYLSGKDFEEYHFWIAHYTKNSPNVDFEWIFWQYSDKGVIKNINSKVAFNVHKGTREELLTLCK
ncbi:MAG: glycoside hydrolase family 25 protein [Prevotellaceae bacterium]|jgi:lysozyme|nr:glycoside hydrolase family 25 protein [Prevotellaceae bacterium]